MEIFPTITDEAQWPQIFMQAALYGYVLSIGADMIGDGAELLMLCPSIAPLVGSIVVPILGAVPDGMMVLCSGLGDDAQEQINVGVGALAGSTVMLLTLPWCISLYVGRVSIKNGEPTYKVPAGTDKLQAGSIMDALFKSGVKVDDQVKANAKLMFVTTISFWVIQIPAFFQDQPGHTYTAAQIRSQKDYEKPFAMAGMALCAVFFTYYMVKMFKDATVEGGAVQAAIIKKTVEGIQNGHMTLRGAMHDFREAMTTELEATKGGLQADLLAGSGRNAVMKDAVQHMCKVLEPFFKNYDQNGDNQINIYEFRLLMQDLRENVSEEKTKAIFDAADMDQSGGINFEEFVACIMAFSLDPFQEDQLDDDKGNAIDAGGEDDGDDDGEEEEDMPPDLADLSPAEQQAAIKKRACSAMFFGSALVLVFSDPMCDLLGTMGAKAGIEPFYVSFLLAPLASNASELVSAKKLAAKKTQTSMKESLSTLCGAAIMNNTFCLFVFFMCFIMKDLVWQFTAETISICLIQYAVGAIAIGKNIQNLMDGFMILCLYPAAMGIVYVLKIKPSPGFD